MAWGDRRQSAADRIRELNERSFDPVALAFLDFDRMAELWKSGVDAYSRLTSHRVGAIFHQHEKSVRELVDAAMTAYLTLFEEVERQRNAPQPLDLNQRCRQVFEQVTGAMRSIEEFDGRFPQVHTELAKAANDRRQANQALTQARAEVTEWVDRLRAHGLSSGALNAWAAQLSALTSAAATPTAETAAAAQGIARSAAQQGAELLKVIEAAKTQEASLRTRTEALSGRLERTEALLSQLRRSYPANCSADLDPAPGVAAERLDSARAGLAGLGRAAGDADQLVARPQQIRADLEAAEKLIVAVESRPRLLGGLMESAEETVRQLAFKVKDAQVLAVNSGADMVRTEGPVLDSLVARVDGLRGRLPLRLQTIWAFHLEVEAVTELLDGSIRRIRDVLARRR